MNLRPRAGEPLPAAVEADYHLCLSCNACRSACTVHMATCRLPPLELVRMAALGMLDDLLRAPQIWYCLQCNQCSNTCPMAVKPSTLVRALRREAIVSGAVSHDTLRLYEALRADFQRVRWHLIDQRVSGEALSGLVDDWRRWAATPVTGERDPIRINASSPDTEGGCAALATCLGFSPDLAACMTCGACATVCPVTHDLTVFDPVGIFRMANLGQHEELMRSPSLWLCLGCQSCTEACTQQVAGHLVIKGLQELSLRNERVPTNFRDRLWEIDHALYARFVVEVNALFAQTG